MKWISFLVGVYLVSLSGFHSHPIDSSDDKPSPSEQEKKSIEKFISDIEHNQTQVNSSEHPQTHQAAHNNSLLHGDENVAQKAILHLGHAATVPIKAATYVIEHPRKLARKIFHLGSHSHSKKDEPPSPSMNNTQEEGTEDLNDADTHAQDEKGRKSHSMIHSDKSNTTHTANHSQIQTNSSEHPHQNNVAQDFVEGLGHAVEMPIESMAEVVAHPQRFVKNTVYSVKHGRTLFKNLKNETKKAFKENPAKATGTAVGMALMFAAEGMLEGSTGVAAAGTLAEEAEAAAVAGRITTVAAATEGSLLMTTVESVAETLSHAEKVNELSKGLRDERYEKAAAYLLQKASRIHGEMKVLEEQLKQRKSAKPGAQKMDDHKLLTKLDRLREEDRKTKESLDRVQAAIQKQHEKEMAESEAE